MRTLRTLFTLFTALGAAAIFVPTIAQQHTVSNDHTFHHGSHVAHLAAVTHDHIALADMHKYAKHHLGEATELPSTYGETNHWTHDWELRWIDYRVSDDVVRVYHALNKHNDSVRFASSWDAHLPRYHGWVPIH